MLKREDQGQKPMTEFWLLRYWRDFCTQVDNSPEGRNEFQFGQYLRERSDET